MRKVFMILFGGIFIIGLLFVIGTSILFGLASRPAPDPLSPAEHAVQDKYDSTFAQTWLSLNPDEWADGKVYKQSYKHGIYRVTFNSIYSVVDFKTISPDILQRTADSVYRDLLPAIPDIDLYDSILIRFNTNYPEQPKGEWRIEDTAFQPFWYVAVYYLR